MLEESLNHSNSCLQSQSLLWQWWWRAWRGGVTAKAESRYGEKRRELVLSV